MTVTLQTVDLIQPVGELEPILFPDGDLDSKLEGWLMQATGKVYANTSIDAAFQDDAARQWVYYLAYSYLGNRLAAMPNSVSVNNGADSVSYGQDRPAYWLARAQGALSLYEGYIVVKPKGAPSSIGIPVKVVW